MDQVTSVCAVCGQPAPVRILEDYAAGQPVVRHFCFECADHYFGELVLEQPPAGHRVSPGTLLVLSGLVVGLLGLTGDHLGIHGAPGFGWRRHASLVAGSLLACVGAFWRIDVIGVVGILVFALAAGANLLGLAGRDGFGWKQHLAIGLGLLLVAVGILIRHRSSRIAARNRRDSA